MREKFYMAQIVIFKLWRTKKVWDIGYYSYMIIFASERNVDDLRVGSSIGYCPQCGGQSRKILSRAKNFLGVANPLWRLNGE